MKNYFFILILVVSHLTSCSTHDKVDWTLIHDAGMKDRVNYGITIRPNGDTIVLSTFSIKIHFHERLDGRYIQFHNNDIVFEFNVINEKKEGESKSYYDSGQLMKRINYHKGEIHGQAIVYHKNGNKQKEMYYDLSERVGVWKYWNENGQLIRTTNY